MLLENKTAIVTGGAKGMGKGMAVKFAEEGCAVAIADIDTKTAKETAAEIKAKGGKAIALECDVTNHDRVHEVVTEVAKNLGKIDILVNNAGAIASHIPIEELPEETWDKVIALNLKSHYLFCKFVVPYMKKARYGKIIGISSIGAIQPPAHEIHYNTAKGGVMSFTYDLANALATYNINVNCILPGPIRTHFYDRNFGSLSESQKEEVFNNIGKKVPLQRMGTPEEIGGAALFLASELSSYITGQCLNVAGGLPIQPAGMPAKQ
jgi:NAD(P)-dependent dehydrogenase (short-subunit alcohol dehydrogenase family)